MFFISQKIEDASIISLNLDFSNKRTKFKITASLQKESPQQEVRLSDVIHSHLRTLIKQELFLLSGRADYYSSRRGPQVILAGSNSKNYEVPQSFETQRINTRGAFLHLSQFIIVLSY
jgi:hypothetical protein